MIPAALEKHSGFALLVPDVSSILTFALFMHLDLNEATKAAKVSTPY
jgi:hypothetical protein